MSDNHVRARAIATVTVEIDLADAWGGDCSLSQIMGQGRDAAVSALMGGLSIDGLTTTAGARKTTARLVGTPTVKAIVVQEGR